MKTQTIITIDNMREQSASIKVKDHSEESVKAGIAKLTGVAVADLKTLNSNHYASLFKVTKPYPELQKSLMFYLPDVHSSYIKRDSKDLHFKVNHGQLHK